MIGRVSHLLKMMIPENDRGLLWASKSRAPSNVTDADGFQGGCIWLNTDGAAGTSLYVNEGSVTVASWTAVDTSAGDAAGTIEFDDATTGPLIAIETDDQEGDAYLNPFLITGTYASACKKGIMLSATNPRPVTFLFDNHSVALGAADYRAVLSRVYLCTNQANAFTLNAMRAQIKLANLVDITSASSVTAPFTGYLELAGVNARTLNGHVACVRAALEEGAAGTTTIGTSLAGFEATLNSTRTYAGSGYSAAYLANISGGTSKWQYGLYIESGAVLTAGVEVAAAAASGILFSGSCTTAAVNITAANLNCIKSVFNIGAQLGQYVQGVKMEHTRSANIQPSTGGWWGMQIVLNAGTGYDELDKTAYVLHCVFKGDATGAATVNVARFETQSDGKVEDLLFVSANAGSTVEGDVARFVAHAAPTRAILAVQNGTVGSTPMGICVDVDETMTTGIQFNTGAALTNVLQITAAANTTYLLLADAVAGCVSATSGTAHGGTLKRIACRIAGVTYYFLVSTAPA